MILFFLIIRIGLFVATISTRILDADCKKVNSIQKCALLRKVKAHQVSQADREQMQTMNSELKLSLL